MSREITWREAWALTSEILRDPDSHTCAALVGWSYVPGPVQRVLTDVFEAYVNTNRGKNTTPFRAPRAWTKAAAPAPGRVAAQDQAQRKRLEAFLFGETVDITEVATPPEIPTDDM